MKKIFISLFILLFVVGCQIEDSSSNTEEINDDKTIENQKTLDQQLIDDITSKDIEVISIDSGASDTDFGDYVLFQIYNINDEERVYDTIYKIMDSMITLKVDKQYIIEIFDKEYQDDLLASYYVDLEGDIKSWFVSDFYNTFYKKWVYSQFSVWNGQHDDLVKLIKKNMNDEKSFDHISTNYRLIETEDDVLDVNKALSDSGFSNQVEINDIYIIMEFSGKNAFNGTIKNYAIGISSYSNNTITLVYMGS